MNYVAANGDSVQELGLPKVEERTFPEELRSFFVSNASYTRRAINVQPLNVVDVFLSFCIRAGLAHRLDCGPVLGH
jgi:hypothetical protein